MAYLTALFLFLQDEKPLPKIAEIENFTGSVEVAGAKGAARKPTRFGTRLRNAEIRDEDRIKTGAGSQAVLLFPDASRFTLKEKSEIQILQKELPKPTPQGETVGRRIKVLVGNLVSEVIPSKDVRTDFDMQVAGSAAVRGTRLEITSTGASATIEVTDGTVRYYHLKYDVVMSILQSQKIRFTEGSLTIEILNDGGLPVDGFIGTRPFGMNGNDRVTVDDNGTTLHGTIGQGPITLGGTDTSNPFDAPRGTGAADEHVDIFSGMPTGGTGPGTAPPDGIFPAADGLLGATEMLGTTSPPTSAGAITIDDFTRANSPNIGMSTFGLTWVEGGTGDWQIVNNTAQINSSGSTANIDLDIGNMTSYNFQADWIIGPPGLGFIEFHVNAGPGATNGCHFSFDVSSDNLGIGDSIGFITGTVTVPVAPNEMFTTNLFSSGTGFCASVTNSLGNTTTLCASGTT